jgi:hypothetical protein
MPPKPKTRRTLRRGDDKEEMIEEQHLAYNIRRVLNIPNIRVQEIANIIYREIKPYLKEE